MEVRLDGRYLEEPDAAHVYLAEKLDLPKYYGGNLDALYDCLTEISEEMHLMIALTGELANNSYLRRLLAVMRDAEEENRFLKMDVEII